eukprot:COSAG01_NODE_52_length_31456_cov_125.226648_20_plen_242_part_00
MFKPKNIALFGASGAIGAAFLSLFEKDETVERIDVFTRSKLLSKQAKTHFHSLDFCQEDQFQVVKETLSQDCVFDLILICSGLLHRDHLKPEKSLVQFQLDNMREVFDINAFAPMLIAKNFMPFLNPNSHTIFAALSARVGSISDNRLGGWYSYRASKAALNMFLKTLSIECKLRYPNTCILGLHPGTVDSELSSPYTSSTPAAKLFTPAQSATYLYRTIMESQLENSGSCLDWEGKTIVF